MQIELSKNLIKLAQLFTSPLYVVGGHVRNSLLGIESFDVDLASDLTPQQVAELLDGTEFSLASINKRLGTLKIIVIGGRESFEYTTFREDSYPQSGAHSPQEVCFTNDILTDAKRRDFKANAVYYDILQDKIIDLLGGLNDIKHRVISTTRSPMEVFSEDGLRILRMVRQACELGFDIDGNTFKVAAENVDLLKDISAQRIREELIKIINADHKYPSLILPNAHERGIRLLDELGALKYVLPDLAESKGFNQHSKFHCHDVFEHTMIVFKNCPPSARIAALLHDLAKPAVRLDTVI
jgi:tRNA nucleotidyltransferase (CCA-adding enzyme)